MGEWPDWSGETAVIVATGPGAACVDLNLCRGRVRVIAVKSSWRLVPWADVLYGADATWWTANAGATGFAGLKVSPSPAACRAYPDIRPVALRRGTRVARNPIGVLACGLEHGGGHSGFQALSIAVQFGARLIALVGFDMHLDRGAHWCGALAVARPDAGRVARWRTEMDAAAPQFIGLGVDVVNCTPGSALTAYPTARLDRVV